MAHINVNLEAVEDGGGDVHPEGPMHLRLVSYEIKSKKDDADKKYIAWRADPASPDAPNKRPVWFNTSLSNLVGLKALVKAVGASFDANGFDPDDMIGGEFIAKLGVETYNDIPKNTVNFPYQKVK